MPIASSQAATLGQREAVVEPVVARSPRPSHRLSQNVLAQSAASAGAVADFEESSRPPCDSAFAPAPVDVPFALGRFRFAVSAAFTSATGADVAGACNRHQLGHGLNAKAGRPIAIV